ncbi:MAG: hypothetical protein K2X27_00025 [Candidatus Obscuribacterales bacterium]|nr:hypothetical protein [Candidatus Obscuribacterales bacterium]
MKHNHKHNSSKSIKLSAKSSGAEQVAYWAQHRKDTQQCMEGRMKPAVFQARYGYLPRTVQRQLNRRGGR